jgi:hypothetical protein
VTSRGGSNDPKIGMIQIEGLKKAETTVRQLKGNSNGINGINGIG